MARRGFKFTVVEIEHLLETIEDVIPIGNPDWERIWQEHSACYPTKERTSESLKCKFQELAHKKFPLVIQTVLLTFAMPSKSSIRLYRLPMGRQVVLMLTKILVRMGLRGMTMRRGMKMRTLISATTMRMTILAFPTPQPSFHVWAKPSVEIIPTLRPKRRERRLVVGVVPTLNPLEVEVVVPILNPLEVGVVQGGRGEQGVALLERRWQEASRFRI
jgi:hypothetical protein